MSKQSNVEFAPTDPDYETAFDKLYLACLWASPSEDVKRGFKELRKDLECYTASEPAEKTYLRIMAGRLHDGLTYGNWPRA